MAGVRYVSAWDTGARSLGAHWIKEGSRPVRDNSLDSLMQVDHVIRVGGDGLVHNDVTGVWAPEMECGTDDGGNILRLHENGMMDYLNRQGWTAERGWSGQDSGKDDGPIMHNSEFVGGSLAEHILTTPGYWVVSAVEVDKMECVEGNDGCTLHNQCSDCTDRGRERECAGWVVMHREAK